MEARHYIPVPAAADDGPLVVVEVRQNGSSPLDVALVGCEGENPYVTSIKQEDIARFKNKHFKGGNADWEFVLSHFLLQKQPEGNQGDITANVKVVYTLERNAIRLHFRQDVEGIKITLGEISLPKDEELEFDPFDWVRASSQAHSAALDDIASLTAKLRLEKDQVSKLHAQLDDFIKTKNESETAMLQQFMTLLNEKKRLIRDQQRLLAGAKVDKAAATAIQSARALAQDSKARKAGPSRSSKRKASKQTAPEPESEDEQMEVDELNAEAEREEEEEMPEAVTPDHSDDETDDEGATLPPGQPKELAEKSDMTASASQSSSSAEAQAKKREDPPPRRELPFIKRTTRAKPKEPTPPPPPADGNDNDTDDDEL